MKRSIFILSLLCITLLPACVKKTEHKIRVNNKYYIAVKVVISGIDFGTVANGMRTDYKVISEGSHQVTGDVNGSLTVSGKGKHNWTLTVDVDGDVEIAEDK